MEKFIVNGQFFNSYEKVIEYNKKNNYRVSATNTTINKKGEYINVISVSLI